MMGQRSKAKFVIGLGNIFGRAYVEKSKNKNNMTWCLVLRSDLKRLSYTPNTHTHHIYIERDRYKQRQCVRFTYLYRRNEEKRAFCISQLANEHVVHLRKEEKQCRNGKLGKKVDIKFNSLFVGVLIWPFYFNQTSMVQGFI